MDTYNYIIKKYSLVIGRQHIVDIPNIGRAHLAELFAELQFKKGVEVGVDRGIYSEALCKANPDAEIIGIDPWSPSAYDPGGYVDENQEFFDNYYTRTKRRMARYRNYKILRKTSLEAMDDFEDNSLDFVYIDANHDFPNVIQDIHGWNRKVRSGGILSGHDYAHYAFHKYNHVKRALEAYTRSYGIIPFFVVGAFNYDEGADGPTATRDRYRSWFWIKK